MSEKGIKVCDCDSCNCWGIIIGFKVLMNYVDENLPISSEDDWI